MNGIMRPVRLVLLIAILACCTVGNAQPSIPKERIPANASAELRRQIERLYSSDPKERAAAVSRLNETAAIPFLIAMFHDDETLYDEDELARRSILSSYASPFPQPNSPGEWAARAVGILGGRAEKPPIDALLAALKDEDLHVRANAIKAIGETRKLEDSSVVDPLAACLDDESVMVRRYAAIALAMMELEKVEKKESLVEGLIERLEDTDRSVRVQAARALGRTKDSSATAPLIGVLENPREAGEVRSVAAESLGEIGDKAAVKPLLAVLKDDDWHVRFSALAVTDLIEDYKVLEPILTGALKDDEWQVRARAARATAALSKLNDPNWLELVGVGLNDGQPNVRACAIQACAEAKDNQTLTHLIGALRGDRNGYVRWHAADALGELGNAGAITALTLSLKDADEHVRTSSRRAIERIKKAIESSRI